MNLPQGRGGHACRESIRGALDNPSEIKVYEVSLDYHRRTSEIKIRGCVSEVKEEGSHPLPVRL